MQLCLLYCSQTRGLRTPDTLVFRLDSSRGPGRGHGGQDVRHRGACAGVRFIGKCGLWVAAGAAGGGGVVYSFGEATDNVVSP